MGSEAFIEQIAKHVQKYAPQYGIEVYSPIIAQAVLESASGASELAVNACNYFGLKYREGRCKTCTGIYCKVGTEQNKDGSYTSSAMKWCRFPDMEKGVIGYFDFINVPNYAKLKGITDPEQYLKIIKDAGYATSLKYVESLMAVIKRYDLTKYDKREENKMSNSPLVSYTKISPNKTSPRNHVIDTITIHCVVGQCSVETLGNVFFPTARRASSNYGVGVDGRIGMYCEEKDRSWCSSSASNDNRAITIEVASDTRHPYAVNDRAMAGLIELLVDICKRNGIKELKWRGDKSLIGQVDKQNMTVHRWFANKSCPGDYLYERHGMIVDSVNRRLGVINAVPTPVVDPVSSEPVTAEVKRPYLVRVATDVLNIRKGPGTDFPVVGKINKGEVYTIVAEADGKGAAKWGLLKSQIGFISLDYVKKM